MLFLALCAIYSVVLPMTDGLLFDGTILRQALYAEESPPAPPPSENAAAAAGPAVPGGTESVADGSREAGSRKLGAAVLAQDLASLSFGPEENPERAALLEKASRGMEAGFLRGHTVCGSTVSAMEVVVLPNWGDQGEPHPDVPSLPLGLRDLVLSWVASHRC